MKEFNPEAIFNDSDDIRVINGISKSYLETKVVLGIDIYKYSQFPVFEQMLIPVIFDYLYAATVRNAISKESFFFRNYKRSLTGFRKNFISTGDGGFQIFDNALQAIVFGILFQTAVKGYCSGGVTTTYGQRLYQIVNNLELRYAITTDKLYQYNSNYYGPAIINNARILSRDSLNRLLIDANTINWFSTNINGLETLTCMNLEMLLKTNCYNKYRKAEGSSIFNTEGKIKSVDILKIGAIQVKDNSLDIFNLHIQAQLVISVMHHEFNTFVISLGNLNTSGIN